MAARADDQRLFHAQELGRSYRILLTNTTRAFNDKVGAIPPGKYLARMHGLGSDIAYLIAVPWVKGQIPTVAAPAAAAATGDVVDQFRIEGFTTFTMHIRAGENDRIAGILSAGSAELHLTKIGS